MSLKNTLLESSSQKTRSPIFPCPYSRASSSQVQLHLDTRFLGKSNSPLIRTKSDSLGFISYIYCKFNFENPKPRSQQCFVAPFPCISPVIPVTASGFMLCLSEIQSPNALRASVFSSCAVPYVGRSRMLSRSVGCLLFKISLLGSLCIFCIFLQILSDERHLQEWKNF